MDLNKSREFFDPNKVQYPCQIIGCGSIGSNVAELLVRQGVKDLTLYDFDIVESHNLVNQNYILEDIGSYKVHALARHLHRINPDCNITIVQEGYKEEQLIGFVFMCVDKVEVRKRIVDKNFYNRNIKVVFDFRTTLLEGQAYATDWTKLTDKKSLLNSLDFTHEEAQENTPVSACGFELSVAPVVKATAMQGIINFTNYINGKEMKKVIVYDPYDYAFIAM